MKLCRLDELAPNSARRIERDGQAPIAVVRIGDDIYAIGDTCSHANISLSQGWIDEADCTIECIQHGATFDLRSGEPRTLPATQPVPIYEVAVVDGWIVLVDPDI